MFVYPPRMTSLKGCTVVFTGRAWIPRKDLIRGLADRGAESAARVTPGRRFIVLVKAESTRWAHGDVGIKEESLAYLLHSHGEGVMMAEEEFQRLYEDRKPARTLRSIAGQPVSRILRNASSRLTTRDDERQFPEELPKGRVYVQGARKRILVNAYERSTSIRRKCLDEHGLSCSVCTLSFEERYGRLGAGFIHVHHTKPVSKLKEGYRLDPRRDLVPICPNCHAMLHREDPPLTVNALRAILKARRTRR
jgi:predicted HNH restriction endonuclease